MMNFSDLNKIVKNVNAPRIKLVRAILPNSMKENLAQRSVFKNENQDLANQVIKLFKNEISSYIELNDFPISYWTEGVSAAIMALQAICEKIYFHKHDYSWLNNFPRFVPILSINEIPKNAVVYISQPFSAIGDYIDLMEFEKRPDLKLFIDLTYWGTMPPKSLLLPTNTFWAAFSFSKNLALWPFRTGLLFSKKKIESLDAYSNVNYLPLEGIHAVGVILEKNGLYFLQSYYRKRQSLICQNLGIHPCNCFLLGQETTLSYRRSLTAEYLDLKDAPID